MTARTPDHAAILAAASFDAIPPLPRSLPTPPAIASSVWSTSTISSMSDASASNRGSPVSRPGLVGEQDQQVGADQVGDEGGHAVVVAEADLVVGDGVVLVDHRHDPELEQAGQGRPGVQVLLADHEVERREQDLAADQPALGQRGVVDPHQAALPDRRRRLQRHRVARADRRHAERGQPGGDGAARHHHHPVPGPPQAHDLGAELADRGVVDLAAVARDRRRADLGHDDHPTASSSS